MRQVQVEIYKFNELSEEAQRSAIWEAIRLRGGIGVSEKSEELYKQIKSMLKASDHEFTESGRLWVYH